MQADLNIASAVALLHRGGVLAYPTEAVWGLGCAPFDGEAVHRLLAIKRRPVDKGLILVASGVTEFDALVDWTALDVDCQARVRDSWPGPHTWIVPATAEVPIWITGGHRSLAVRVSAHPQVAALCAGFGGPLVSTSANLTGEPAQRERDALSPALLALVDGVCAGETGDLASATPIRDARTGAVLRA